MRVVTIRRGLFKGEHKIYDSPEESSQYGIEPKIPWHRKDILVGDWVVADDGYVVQCLARKRIVNKKHINGQYTDTFRFPQGLFYVYYNRLGEKRITKNFYAQVIANNKSSMGNTPSIGRYMTINKREFVAYMQMGFDAYSAYMKAFKVKSTSLPYITIQINKLLADEQVREELMQVLKPFMVQVADKVKEISGYNDLNSLLIDKTAKLLVQTTNNIKDQVIVLKFAYEFFGKVLNIVETQPEGKKRELEEALYEEIMPSPLPQSVAKAV
jgi:hypothetical protein